MTRRRGSDSRSNELLKIARRARDHRLVDAIGVWQRLSRARQRVLARETVITSGAVLRLAYPDIVGLAHGYRTIMRAGTRQVTNEPCVTFMVDRKWKIAPRSKRVRERELPGHLLAFVDSGSPPKRKLCAVPTDVECRTTYRVAPQRRLRVAVTPPAAAFPEAPGVITCAVRVKGLKTIYAMSCHHVLAIPTAPGQHGQPIEGASCWLEATRERIAVLSMRRGQLRPDHDELSFDSSLSTVRKPAYPTLKAALGRRRFTGLRDALALPPATCFIRTPTGDRAAQYVQTWEPCSEITYFDDTVMQPKQAAVIEWRTTDVATVGGDSGSPVTDRARKLLGMHIAGDPAAGTAFMLPSEMLFNGLNYGLSRDLDLVQPPFPTT